jgi:hypothetical protein
MNDLKKTVTVQVKVDSRIADLVYFAKSLRRVPGFDLANCTDEALISLAEDFWDTQHGED